MWPLEAFVARGIAHLERRRARKDATMRTILILIQVGFLSTMAVIGAASGDKPDCQLPAPTAQHCEVTE
jgi:hypothetical protein